MPPVSATAATDPGAIAQPASQPGSAPDETVLLSIAEAAEALGISPQVVRKRIARGHLPARRTGRAWQVILDRATAETGATATDATTAQPRAKPGAHLAQPQAEQMAALIERIQAPLLDRIEAMSREAERERIARETADRFAAEADAARLAAVVERDELSAELEILRGNAAAAAKQMRESWG
jgi:excisionase family DNA binding protein